MRFHPKPISDEFPEFIETYFGRCRAACPKISACAGKWRPEDLIPGLSDFDTRFLVEDGTRTQDWIEMSLAVGQVHTELAKERPAWARILEHLPGVNLTWAEMLDPVFYFPEFAQWTFYHGDSKPIQSVQSYLREMRWGRRDEMFHLKKFATYFGPYQRGIDPPVNLGVYENKYPLHSRLMHYFTPAVQSAVSLAQRRTCQGKLEALQIAKALFPSPAVIDLVLEVVEKHYELEDLYEEPALSILERALEEYLRKAYASLADAVTLITIDQQDCPQQVRSKVASVPAEPAESFFEGVRYCRLMKGRLLFYAMPISWFETSWLIRNDLGRMANYFYAQPLVSYGIVQYGKTLGADQVFCSLCEELLSPEECRGMKTFLRVVSLPVAEGREKEQAGRVAATLDPVLACLERLKVDLRQRLQSQVEEANDIGGCEPPQRPVKEWI